MIGLTLYASAGIGVPISSQVFGSVVAFGLGGECIALPVIRRAVRGDRPIRRLYTC
jgi:hypothetical protein